MKRLVLVAAVFAVAACAKKDEATVDSSAAMAPAPAPSMTDSATRADSIRKDSITKDSIRKADSATKKP